MDAASSSFLFGHLGTKGVPEPTLSDHAVEHAPVGIGWVDDEGFLVRTNAMLGALLGMKDRSPVRLAPLLAEKKLVWREPGFGLPGTPLMSGSCRYETSLANGQGGTTEVAIRVSELESDGEHFDLIIVEDLTELRRIQHQVASVQRLESMGILAGGIAHDLNNTLAPILLGIELMRSQQAPGQARWLETMQASAERATGLVSQMLMFAKRADLRREPRAAAGILKELARIVGNTLPSSIRVSFQGAESLPAILCDDVHLLRVLLNLVLNARDAMPRGGELTIDATRVEVDQSYIATVSEARAGSYVKFTVSDTGVGIPVEIRERIFDPFFTTKGPDKGTGLGLSAVLGVVKGHDGFLNLYSEVNRGTRISVYIPAVGEPIPDLTPPPELAAPDFSGRTRLALVVDDEVFVREAIRLILEQLGFQVIEAEDGARALAAVARSRTPVDLVLTDLHMPSMNGVNLIRALRRTRADLPVIAMSGRVGADERETLTSAGVTQILSKPFGRAVLMGALQAALGEVSP